MVYQMRIQDFEKERAPKLGKVSRNCQMAMH